MTKVADLKINVEVIGTEVASSLLDTIGALHTRNKGLQKGHATLTQQTQDLRKELVDAADRNIKLREENGALKHYVQEMEHHLEGCHEAISRLTGVTQNHVKRRMATEDGKERMRKHFQHQNCRCAEAPLSDRAVDAIIADVMKPEPTAADQRLADDIYSLRRRIACDLHEWSRAAEPVLSRLAAAEHAIKLHNELRRRGK